MLIHRYLVISLAVTLNMIIGSYGNGVHEEDAKTLRNAGVSQVSGVKSSDAISEKENSHSYNQGWTPGHFGLESTRNKHERRRQRKQERRKERQERRERRRHKHRVHATQPFSNMPHFMPGEIIFDEDIEEQRPTVSPIHLGSVPFNLENLEGKPLLPQNKGTSQLSWLENNITSIWLTLQYIQKNIKQLRRQMRNDNPSKLRKSPHQGGSASEAATSEPCHPEWVIEPHACTDSQGLTCGGKGKCSCGQCVCESPFYGIHCRCNDMICESHGGVLCGGAGQGQCRCGACVCRPEFTGKACECSLSTSECRKGNGPICNGNGLCVCNRCQCQDGYTGQFCDESIYSASICEKLKPCVLCMAYGKKYPQCEDCNIQVENVDEIESSRATCVMVNLGCILKYAYVNPKNEGDKMTVLVNRQRSC